MNPDSTVSQGESLNFDLLKDLASAGPTLTEIYLEIEAREYEKSRANRERAHKATIDLRRATSLGRPVIKWS